MRHYRWPRVTLITVIMLTYKFWHNLKYNNCMHGLWSLVIRCHIHIWFANCTVIRPTFITGARWRRNLYRLLVEKSHLINSSISNYRKLETARGHTMPPPLHLSNIRCKCFRIGVAMTSRIHSLRVSTCLTLRQHQLLTSIRIILSCPVRLLVSLPISPNNNHLICS